MAIQEISPENYRVFKVDTIAISMKLSCRAPPFDMAIVRRLRVLSFCAKTIVTKLGASRFFASFYINEYSRFMDGFY